MFQHRRRLCGSINNLYVWRDYYFCCYLSNYFYDLLFSQPLIRIFNKLGEIECFNYEPICYVHAPADEQAAVVAAAAARTASSRHEIQLK